MTEQTTTPDLTGRQAMCGGGVCKTVVPSSAALPFFEYKGPGSRYAEEICGTCGMHEVAHGEINKSTGRPGVTGHPFVANGGANLDSHYCGCSGWD